MSIHPGLFNLAHSGCYLTSYVHGIIKDLTERIDMDSLLYLVLCCVSLGVHWTYGDTNNDCVFMSEEGQSQTFKYATDYTTYLGNYRWLMTIQGSRVQVADGSVSLPGFSAFSSSGIYPGVPSTLYLTVMSLNRSMSDIQCTNTFSYFATREVYGFCKLVIFVRPKIPVCQQPRYDVDGQFFEVLCYTYVTPRGICNFTLDKTSPISADAYRVQYTHEYLYSSDLYKTTCKMIIPFSGKQMWNTNLAFNVTAAPNITNYQNYTASSNFNVSFKLVRPTTPVCDAPRFANDGNYFEVSCQTYVHPQGTCRFTSDKTVNIQSYRVKYSHEYSYDTKLYLTMCTLIVPFPDRPPWNTNLNFTLTASPNISDYHNFTVSSNFNVNLRLDAPDMISFAANRRHDTVHYNEGDNLKFQCFATGTPKPRMSLLNDKGAILYVSEMPGTLEYTIYSVSCGQSEAYTCLAENGRNVSTKITAVGSCPHSSSSTSSVPVVQISIGVVASVFGLVGLIVVIRSCRRRCHNINRPLQRSLTNERLIGSTPSILETHRTPQSNQPNTRVGNTPNRALNSNTGTLFIILATTSRDTNPPSQQNLSNSVVSPPPYDVPSNSPPEYTEVTTQRVNPYVYDDQPPEYSLGGSMEA